MAVKKEVLTESEESIRVKEEVETDNEHAVETKTAGNQVEAEEEEEEENPHPYVLAPRELRLYSFKRQKTDPDVVRSGVRKVDDEQQCVVRRNAVKYCVGKMHVSMQDAVNNVD